MKNKDIIVDYLENHQGSICDDCLSEQTGIKPRQQINQLCRNLDKIIVRSKDDCLTCGKNKMCNQLITETELNTTHQEVVKDRETFNNKSSHRRQYILEVMIFAFGGIILILLSSIFLTKLCLYVDNEMMRYTFLYVSYFVVLVLWFLVVMFISKEYLTSKF